MVMRSHNSFPFLPPPRQGSREQLAIAEFAAALLTIPKTLAVNSAKDSTDLVAKLRAYHHAAQNAPAGDPKRRLRFYGLDLIEGDVRDNVRAGVLEPAMSKVRSLKSALEASTSLLRIVCCFVLSRSVAAQSDLICDLLNPVRKDDQITVPREEKGAPDPHGH
jgi:T-complex protein 1 subunit alpha